jgi:hypothetical protein
VNLLVAEPELRPTTVNQAFKIGVVSRRDARWRESIGLPLPGRCLPRGDSGGGMLRSFGSSGQRWLPRGSLPPRDRVGITVVRQRAEMSESQPNSIIHSPSEDSIRRATRRPIPGAIRDACEDRRVRDSGSGAQRSSSGINSESESSRFQASPSDEAGIGGGGAGGGGGGGGGGTRLGTGGWAVWTSRRSSSSSSR